MATEHGTDLIPGPPIQTTIYPLLIAAGFAIVLSALGIALVLSGIVLALYAISKVLRFQHGRIAAMARGAE